MMNLIVALLMIVCGAFCVFLGGAIFYEMSFMAFGFEAICMGFTGVLSVLCGLACFACLTEV